MMIAEIAGYHVSTCQLDQAPSSSTCSACQTCPDFQAAPLNFVGMNTIRNFALGATAATLARYTWSSVYDVQPPSSYTICTTGHGTIYTVDETNPTAECVSVKDGRLVAVGSRGKFMFDYKRHR